MRVLKTGDQRNFIINKDSYDIYSFLNLVKEETIAVVTENYELENIMNDTDTYNIFYGDYDCRIFVEDCTDIRVAYNNHYGLYENIVITQNGNRVHVKL